MGAFDSVQSCGHRHDSAVPLRSGHDALLPGLSRCVKCEAPVFGASFVVRGEMYQEPLLAGGARTASIRPSRSRMLKGFKI